MKLADYPNIRAVGLLFQYIAMYSDGCSMMSRSMLYVLETSSTRVWTLLSRPTTSLEHKGDHWSAFSMDHIAVYDELWVHQPTFGTIYPSHPQLP